MSPVDDDGGRLDGYSAFVALQSHAGNVPPDTMGIKAAPVGEALTALLDDESVSNAIRLDVLRALAKADFPDYESAAEQYEAMAAKVAFGHGITADQLLGDLKAHAQGDADFATSPSAAALPHEVVAFFDQDICHAYKVVVGNKKAVWLYGELETDSPFDKVADWVDPRNWPQRTPMVFKSMTPVGVGIQNLPVGQFAAWHSDFLEVVELAKELNTVLHCNNSVLPGVFAASSYDLVRSVDGEIDVDRGFLSVNELGATRNVKCLKVVGFTDDYWDEQALRWACLGWTHFIRSAVEGGTNSIPIEPIPPLGGASLEEVIEGWFDCLKVTSSKYVSMGTDWVGKLGPGYGLDDAVGDAASWWLSVATDWANASVEMYQNLQILATDDAGSSPVAAALASWLAPLNQTPSPVPAPSAAAAAAAPVGAAVAPQAASTAPTAGYEGTTLPVDGLTPNDQLACGDMRLLGDTKDAVPASLVRLSIVAAEQGGGLAIRVEIPVGNLAPGLYIGDVVIAGKGTRPLQVYVSRARAVGNNA